MLLALLLGQLLLQPAAPRGPIVTNPATMGTPADVRFLAPGGLGATAECACTQPSVVLRSGALAAVTTTRATGAACFKSDFSVVFCAANQARLEPGGGPGQPVMLRSEFIAKTNEVLQHRSLNNAAWTKTNASCTQTATGWDGAANGGSTCTASAANGTVLQTVAVTGQYAGSMGIRKRVLTGRLWVTVDGSTFTDVSASLSSTIYKRVVNTETTGTIGGGNVVVRALQKNFAASPVIGIKFENSGDSVDVDLVQLEAGYFSTSPWPNASSGTPQTRAGESHSATVPAFTPRSVGYRVVSTGWPTGSKYNINSSLQKDVNNEFSVAWDTTYGPMGGSPFCFWVNAGSYQELYSTEVTPTMGPVWVSCFNDGTTEGVNVAGWTVTQAATVSPATAITTIWLGARTGAGSYGVQLGDLCYDADATKCVARGNVAPAAVVWVGDSITAGSVSAPTMPPAELSAIIGRTVWNKGVPGDNVAGCHSRWANRVRGKGFTTLVYACGTNDMIAGSVPAAHAAWTQSQQTLEQALADGLRVFAGNIIPEGAAAAYNVNIQSALNAYNADWAAWCSANASNPLLKCVDSFTVFKTACPDAGPDCLNPALADVDQRHLNGAGSTFYAYVMADAGV